MVEKRPEEKKKSAKIDPRSLLPPGPTMIEVIANDRLGQKVKVKCLPEDTVGDLKKLISAHTGTKAEKIRLQKGYVVYKDHITLNDYEIKDGTGLEMYYN